MFCCFPHTGFREHFWSTERIQHVLVKKSCFLLRYKAAHAHSNRPTARSVRLVLSATASLHFHATVSAYTYGWTSDTSTDPWELLIGLLETNTEEEAGFPSNAETFSAFKPHPQSRRILWTHPGWSAWRWCRPQASEPAPRAWSPGQSYWRPFWFSARNGATNMMRLSAAGAAAADRSAASAILDEGDRSSVLLKEGFWTHNARLERRFDLPLLQQRPVDLSEERVSFDGLLQALSRHAAQTLAGTFCHELQKKSQK